jgi:ChaB/Rho termination factor, N-terminal domain
MPSEHQQAEKMRADVPSTIARSDDKAVRTYKKTLESAEDSYDDGERAHRAAFGALKHTYEKVGDHWEPKEQAGPSDQQAEQKAPDSLEQPKETAEGVDAQASKAHLVDVAKKVGVTGATRMRKAELVDEIRKANARATRRARS